MTRVLELELSRAGPGRYSAHILNSPVGEASATFELDSTEIIKRLPDLQATILASAVSSRRFVGHGEGTVQSIGQLLFDAAFSADVASVYRASVAIASDHDENLRLVLRLGAPELAALPWECLFDRSIDRFVARREPLIRHLSVPLSPPPLKVAPPLRILAVISSPRNLAALDVEKERRTLTQALSPLVDDGAFEVHWIEKATWPAVQEALIEGPWHVVHFIGHGDFDIQRDEGVIFLEDEQAWAQRVSATNFVDLLREAQPMPRLVVLNACESSTPSRTDVFSSSAATLVRGGVSAVTAMQFEITDPAAIAFCSGFYSAIAHQRGVDEAVTSGRRRILGLGEGSLEWITPTLYLRGRTTQLFSRSEISNREAALEQYRSQAHDAADSGDPETVILLMDSILAEDPDDKNARIARDRSLTEARSEGDQRVDGEPNPTPPTTGDDIWAIVAREAAPHRVREADIANVRRALAPDEKIIRCVNLPLGSDQDASIIVTNDYLHLVTSAPDHAGWRELVTRAPAQVVTPGPGHLRIVHPSIIGVDTDSTALQLEVVDHGPWRLSSVASESTQFVSRALEETYGPARSSSPDTPVAHRRLPLILTAVGVSLVTVIITAIALRPGPRSESATDLPMSRPLSASELVVARWLDDKNWDLYLANVTSTTPGWRLTEREGTDSAPVLSPDRRTVIYIRIEKKTGVRTLRVAGAADLNGDRPLFQLPAGCTQPLRPAWNPGDASMLAIGCRDTARRVTLRLMRTDGTVAATVDPPAGMPQIDDLAFSPDGRHLGFWASSNKKAADGRLFSVTVAGGTPEPIFASDGPETAHDADLAFSPDGSHIAFSRRNGSGTDIMVSGADGSGAVALITGRGHNQAPTWSPDGSRIAYKSDVKTPNWPGKSVPRIWVTSSTRADPHLLWTRDAPEQQSTPAWR